MGTSTFLTLNIGVSAIEAMTQAESVVGNNIANANNTSYAQETAVLGEGLPYEITPGTSISQGVDVTSVNRDTDSFLIQQDRANQGAYQMYSTHSSGLSEIESILNEPSSNGLQNSLDQFFSAWQTLTSSSSDPAARQTVISQAQTLAQTFEGATTQLEQLQANLNNVVYGSSSYTPGTGELTDVSGTTSSTGTGNAIASDVEVLNSPQSSTDNLHILFTASPNSSGTTSYTVQLEDSEDPPQAIGPAVPVTGAGTYQLGSSSGVLVSAQIADPSTLLPSSYTTGDTYTQTDAVTPPGGELQELNGYAYQVEQLNQQIKTEQSLNQSVDPLLDQRDQILDSMANLANISYTTQSDGSVSVQVGNASLVSSSGVVTPLSEADVASQVTSGTMKGNLDSSSDTGTVLGQLNSFLQQFAQSVNAIQQQGYGTNNPSSKAPPLFSVSTDADGNTVLSLADEPGTSTPVDAGDVAASGEPNQPGDNSNAQAMVALQTDASAYQNGTFDQGIAQVVSSVGVEASAVSSSEETANALAQQSSSMRDSVSGVDTNQQAALLVQYQNSYDAAAKLISVYDTMLQSLISMVPS